MEKSDYMNICFHCKAENPYSFQYYKCCGCGKMTIPIVVMISTYEAKKNDYL
jgi:hypothetical protein